MNLKNADAYTVFVMPWFDLTLRHRHWRLNIFEPESTQTHNNLRVSASWQHGIKLHNTTMFLFKWLNISLKMSTFSDRSSALQCGHSIKVDYSVSHSSNGLILIPTIVVTSPSMSPHPYLKIAWRIQWKHLGLTSEDEYETRDQFFSFYFLVFKFGSDTQLGR